SLGIAYMTDLLPNTLLPAGNIMISVWFSVGSIIGPLLSGTFIDLFPNISFFYLVVAMLGFVLLLMLLKNKSPKPASYKNPNYYSVFHCMVRIFIGLSKSLISYYDPCFKLFYCAFVSIYSQLTRPMVLNLLCAVFE